MPSSVAELFAAAGLQPEGVVRWGTPVPEARPGVYVVALTDDPRSMVGVLGACPLDRGALDELLGVRPELRMDGQRPSAEGLGRRLAACWLADEVVLYIGLAGRSVRGRVGEYYATPLGARSPHAGGWPLKTLAVLPELYVHFTACEGVEHAERDMLCAFAAQVSAAAREALHDPQRLLPFANLTGPDGRKAHGITGARASRHPSGQAQEGAPHAASAEPAPTPARALRSVATASPAVPSGRYRSQRVTEKDIEAGYIRVPRDTKVLFPPDRTDVWVNLRGERLAARWDPRVGPDRERSGLIRVGSDALARKVEPNEVLAVSAAGEYIELR